MPETRQRFTADHPCPICQGHEHLPRGQGERCWGFLSDDGTFAHCTNTAHAGGLRQNSNSQTYAHLLIGNCKCGIRHDPNPPPASTNGHKSKKHAKTSKPPDVIYDYTDASGTLLYQALRYHLPNGDKTFKQRRPDGYGGWDWTTTGLSPVIYHLPEVNRALAATHATICLAEGEKDVHTLESYGYTATTNHMGAGKWTWKHSLFLRGATDVVIFGDNDPDGRAHVEKQTASLMQIGIAPRLAQLDGLPEHGDITNWMETHTKEDLAQVIREAIPATDASDLLRHTASDALNDQQPPLPWSDQTNAEQHVAWYGQDMRYCERWKCWLVWDGRRWAIDETGQVMRWAKATIKRLAGEIVDMDEDQAKPFLAHIKKSLSYRSLSDMVKSAASEPNISVLSEDFDKDQMLFNVHNGTLDLRTGQIRPHERTDLLMKCSPVVYDAEATCPDYDAFLQAIYQNDQELIMFDETAAGYTLTGDTREQQLFICHGTGNNGKSTRLSIMREVMGEGEYALRTDIKAFTEANAKYRPASAEYYLAKLHNVRFAYASENEEGAKLSESLIKDVTGGVDFINARLPYGHPFTFLPRFKLWLGTNHEPIIRGTDPAIWRRPRKIPFLQSFEGREDKDLFRKLCLELPGILNRMVRGCLRWQINGLTPPSAVKDATAAYKKGMDIVGRFIEECCFLGKDATGHDAKVESTQLYEAYKKWCEQTGEEPMSQMRLAARLKERGLHNDTRSEITNRIQWTGIGIFR